jgi:hypothetical protein
MQRGVVEMDVRRGVAAGLVGLALLAGTTGCSKIGEKVAEEAIEQNSNCENVDINTDEGGFAGNCDGNDIDANLAGDADLPEGWPSELAPPEGLKIVTSNATDTPIRSLNVIGSLDGDVATVYEGIKTQLTAAGYTIDTDSLADGPTGPAGTLAATGPEYTAAVSVSEIANALDGNVTVTYTLNAVG